MGVRISNGAVKRRRRVIADVFCWMLLPDLSSRVPHSLNCCSHVIEEWGATL
jgi:hypothetical protein